MRELDALVAEKVLGWTWLRWHNLDYQSPDGPLRRTLCPPGEWLDDDPKYVEWDPTDPAQDALEPHGPHQFKPSTDIAAAWRVVEAMREKGWDFIVGSADENVKAFFTNGDGSGGSIADTAPEAICRAALRALGVETEQADD